MIYHFTREHVSRLELAFPYCSTDRNTADCMTKALPVDKFVICRTGMGISGSKRV